MNKNALDQIMEIINNHDQEELPGIQVGFFSNCLIKISELGSVTINKKHFHKTHLMALIIQEFIKMNNNNCTNETEEEEENPLSNLSLDELNKTI